MNEFIKYSELFSNIVSPIAALAAIYFYARALQTSQDQNQILYRDNVMNRFFYKIDLLQKEIDSLYIIKVYNPMIKKEYERSFNQWFSILETQVCNTSIFEGCKAFQSEEKERNLVKKSNYHYEPFFAHMESTSEIIQHKEFNRILHEIHNFKGEISSSKLQDYDKRDLLKQVDRQLLGSYYKFKEWAKDFNYMDFLFIDNYDKNSDHFMVKKLEDQFFKI